MKEVETPIRNQNCNHVLILSMRRQGLRDQGSQSNRAENKNQGRQGQSQCSSHHRKTLYIKKSPSPRKIKKNSTGQSKEEDGMFGELQVVC